MRSARFDIAVVANYRTTFLKAGRAPHAAGVAWSHAPARAGATATLAVTAAATAGTCVAAAVAAVVKPYPSSWPFGGALGAKAWVPLDPSTWYPTPLVRCLMLDACLLAAHIIVTWIGLSFGRVRARASVRVIRLKLGVGVGLRFG